MAKNNNRSRSGNRPIGQKIVPDYYNPYAFVPMSEKVLFLPENEEKSLRYAQDVPYSDGISGVISVSMSAQSPFCVKASNSECTSVGGRYFVPGTSIKGMIRSVFEIITLSNIKTKIEDNRYSMRDLYSRDYKLKENSNNPEQKSGFLIMLEGKYYIVKAATYPEKFDYDKIGKIMDVDAKSLRESRNIQEKYSIVKDAYFKDDEGYWYMWFFSGFMQNKKHEYLFGIPDKVQESDLIPIENDVLKDFLFIHEEENKNESWKYWKSRLSNARSINELFGSEGKGYAKIVPCFFRTKRKVDGKQVVRDLGFAFLYRTPYEKTIHDFLPEMCNERRIDMSQALFGYVERTDCLKGRVQFSHAFILNGQRVNQSEAYVLGQPHPTFYPFYIKQENSNRNTTYFSKDKDVRISGWKRYLVHDNIVKGTTDPQIIRSKSASSFVALSSGATVKFDIYIHNLRPWEVGALLSAITFCGNSDKCYHALGYAKPFGYGKMKVEGMQLNLNSNDPKQADPNELEFYTSSFEQYLLDNTEQTQGEWQSYLRPLLKLSEGGYDKPIHYPELQAFKDIKKFNSMNDFLPPNILKK